MCKHKHQTLCQCLSDEGWYIAYQCDMCGMVTNEDVKISDIDRGADLPNLDRDAYQAELARRVGKLIASMEVSR